MSFSPDDAINVLHALGYTTGGAGGGVGGTMIPFKIGIHRVMLMWMGGTTWWVECRQVTDEQGRAVKHMIPTPPSAGGLTATIHELKNKLSSS